MQRRVAIPSRASTRSIYGNAFNTLATSAGIGDAQTIFQAGDQRCSVSFRRGPHSGSRSMTGTPIGLGRPAANARERPILFVQRRREKGVDRAGTIHPISDN